MVQSPIVKILEARFLPKLQEYLTYKLDRSQTGFVRKMGVQVNLTRALERITMRTKQKKPVYGLFIDFSNAYNSVPHTLLFKKLREKHLFTEEEVCFLEQLYVRYRIKLGNAYLKTNKGVAQGSVISPALFNIFIEDLSQKLEEKAGISMEDRLYYADDILLLTTSTEQLEKAIETVESWSTSNGMTLNKAKSGIVIFAHRRATKVPKMEKITEENSPGKEKKRTKKSRWVPKEKEKEIAGVPICDKYKYLGTWLDPKLTCGPQIGHIKKKTAHIFVKLYPYLSSASADARRDMWQTMIAPLFNAALVLLEFEHSETQRLNLERVRRLTFKQFMMISKRTNTTLVDEMIRKNLRVVAQATVTTCNEQWEQRKAYQGITSSLPCLARKNGLRGVPNNWCELVNTMVKPCPKCKTKGIVTSRWHLLTEHRVRLPHINYIWKKDILPISLGEVKERRQGRDGPYIKVKRKKRQDIRQVVKPIIEKHLQDYYTVYGKLVAQGVGLDNSHNPRN